MRQMICHCAESHFVGTTKQSYPIRLFEKGSTLWVHGGDGLSYVIMNIQQKTKKEDLKNEYTLEE